MKTNKTNNGVRQICRKAPLSSPFPTAVPLTLLQQLTQRTYHVALLLSASHFTPEMSLLNTDMCSKHEAISLQNLLIYRRVIPKMFKALLVVVTVLSTVRLKGKYIMQMFTASQQDWKRKYCTKQ